ncbi:MAG: DUF1569 domain-containing protein [Ignavibacteriae bacterium]|nr:DUF1569 domain-containing protein [Ignavibacteriota bacterium]
MKNILDLDNINFIINRINSLSNDTQRLWGKMTVNQMLCHCSDQIKMACGKIKISSTGNFLQRRILKHLILLGLPAPKGRVQTYKELDQNFNGTKPTDFEKDKEFLINTIQNFNQCYPENLLLTHSTFGKMNKKQWGRLIYIHLDHHLRQFGV